MGTTLINLFLSDTYDGGLIPPNFIAINPLTKTGNAIKLS